MLVTNLNKEVRTTLEEIKSTIQDRQQLIHDKGFDMTEDITNYSKIKIGQKTLEDAVLSLGSLKNSNRKYTNKD